MGSIELDDRMSPHEAFCNALQGRMVAIRHDTASPPPRQQGRQIEVESP
jgi:hypothetical protein